MGYNQAYSAYQKTNVKTASQGHLVVLLYEAAVKNLGSALSLYNAEDKILPGDIEKYSNFIQKAQNIITELQVSLDMEKGGEISKNLMSLYVYFNSELISSIINHDKNKITFVKEQLEQLLSAWKVASSSTANAPAKTSESVLNIEG